ncbi:MAG: hypothetical protein LBG80_05655 [Bacteroidales bacterium]|jgi:uncharacterized protein YlxW (UPF0749 family)|nr:hypothetical protein [Bacteroidales bacterium]
MLKKTTIILLSFILCGIVGSAQHIDKEKYENLVDFVKHYYENAYLNKKKKQKLKDTEEAIQNKKNQLGDAIENKKNSFDTTWNKDKVIETLIALPTDKPEPNEKSFDHFLKDEKKELKEHLEQLMNDEADANITDGQDIPIDTARTDTTIPAGGKTSFPWSWIIVIAITSIAIWESLLRKRLLIFIPNKKHKDNGTENHKLKTENKSLKNEVKKLETKNKELFDENIHLGQKIESYQYKSKRVAVSEIENETDKNTHDPISTLYSDAIIDGFFNRVREVPNEDTIFELHLQIEQMANFTIYPSAYKRVIANPDFLEGCDKQALHNAQNVTIESQGIAQKQPDGKWKITKKPNIIIS